MTDDEARKIAREVDPQAGGFFLKNLIAAVKAGAQASATAGPPPGATIVEQPLIIMFQAPDEKVICHLHWPPDWTHASYGLVICDLVRHVAAAFKVPEEAVWEWVDKERASPTTKIEGGRPQ